jgi:hypothetical protein
MLAFVWLYKFKKDMQYLIKRSENLIRTVNCLLFSGFKNCSLLFFELLTNCNWHCGGVLYCCRVINQVH